MFTHMSFVRSVVHEAGGFSFGLDVYRVAETGEHRIYISRDGEGLGVVATASSEVVSDAKKMGDDVVEVLIQAGRDEIEANEGNVYFYASSAFRPCHF